QTPVPRTATHAPLPAATAGTSQLSPTAALRTPTTARPRTVTTMVKPKPVVSPVLLIIFYVVSIAGAAWAAWYFANKMHANVPEASFHRMTFRRGEVRGARFGSDGDTIVYSAAWDGQPSEIYVVNRHSPEAR